MQREPVPGICLGLRLGILHNANATALRRIALVDREMGRLAISMPGVADRMEHVQAERTCLSYGAPRELEFQRALEPLHHQVIVFEQTFGINRLAPEQGQFRFDKEVTWICPVVLTTWLSFLVGEGQATGSQRASRLSEPPSDNLMDWHASWSSSRRP